MKVSRREAYDTTTSLLEFLADEVDYVAKMMRDGLDKEDLVSDEEIEKWIRITELRVESLKQYRERIKSN